MKDRIQKGMSLDNLLYLAVSLYMLDVILLGTGDLIRIGGISSRIIFFFVAMVLCIPAVLKNFKVYVKSPAVWAVGAYMAIIFIAMIVGFVNGNHRVILISDVKGYLNFLIVIPMTYILSNKERIMKLFQIMVNSIFAVSIIGIILSYYQFFPQAVQKGIYKFVHDIGFAAIAGLTENATRIFMHSGTRMFALGLLLSFALFLIEKDKKKLRYLQMTACLVTTFMSYARALYVGLIIAVVVLLVFVVLFYKDYLEITLRSYVIVCVCAVVMILAVGITQQSNLFKIAISRCLVAVDTEGQAGTDSDNNNDSNNGNNSNTNKPMLDNIDSEVESLEIRAIRKEMATKNFLKSPVFGNGLGVVNDPNKEHIEYFYLDLLSKMGIIGLVLFFLPAGVALYNILRLRDKYESEQRILSLVIWCDWLFLAFISYFNPCMNTAIGLMIYALAITMSIPWGTFKNVAIEKRG